MQNKKNPENGNSTPEKKKGLVVSVLHEISRVAVRVKDVSMLLKEVLDILHAQMNLTRGTVTLKNGDVLVIRASHGLSDEERKRGVYRVGEGVTGDVAARGVSRIVEDISRSPDFLNRTGSRHMDVKTAFLCVPIVCRNSVIGTLSIDRENPTRYELKRDLKLLETIANIIAYAVSVLLLDMEENEKLNAENRDLRERIDQELRPENAIGSSPAMLKAYELISAAGSGSAHVLIRGEVGTGKDFAMRAIANAKMWRSRPLEILDCSTMRDSLIDAALFGSQSPSHRTRPGLVEKAENGIVYLDSMGLIGQPLQVKLLKFLTDGTYSRCGETKVRRSCARIIASTSGDLETRLRDGIIRPDFYYRISVFTINIPPLRQRRRDIPQLAKFFLQKHAALRGKKITAITPAAMNMLICGLCFSEILGKRGAPKWQVAGSALIAVSAIASVFFKGAKMWIVIHAGVIAMIFLPVAYCAFMLIMNSRKILGSEVPKGGKRVLWNVLMFCSVIASLTASLWVLWNKLGMWGPAILAAFALAVAASCFLRARKGGGA